MQNAKVEYELRKKNLIKQGLWRGDRKSILIYYGNTHEEIMEPKASKDQKHVNKHRWAMFVSLGKPDEDQASNENPIK